MKRFALPIFFILAMTGVAKFYFHIQAQEKVQAMINRLSPFVTISYVDLDVEFNGHVILQEVTLSDSYGKTLLNIDELVVYDFQESERQESIVPATLDIELKDVLIHTRPSASTQKFAFYELGYQELHADMHFIWHYSDFANTLGINSIIKVNEVADVSAHFELANFDPDQWRYYLRDPSSILLMSVLFSFHDHSLLNKVMAYMAKKNHTTTADIREQFIAKMNFYKHQATANDKQWRENLSEKWIHFVQNPDEIYFSADNKEGVSLRKLRITPRDKLPELLNLKIYLIKIKTME